ncbi:helix-turn-helix domain-containing protein [Streptomyces somaliensis DSM 40738]|uniref:Helix-turn-helix domain-containing protein n=1 Tax=Streptomyces somaliensis (strain ATCC 33201 / DSM 40738 / JCM 12659 / KCTC 9044 / NCTC 11332 / NRRL B-12077 / IP 733) TaxID=1134445 RepID=A0AA44DA64_STRE0|nr:helix-turn-helix transcriptional regulator [Streptomyces somaliensis]MCQ0024988.1 helix-turn-helix domain-containing protein [Streptomyces somaliensis DSM 40738]NKY12723.1 helix-turn-helix domain-containing protein [Streptomyces somaliensis DSM 40738]
MSEPTRPAGQVSGGGEGGADERHPEPDVNSGVLRVFGRQLKRFRLRAGLERPEFGSMTGYSVPTIAAYEQGRRVPPPRFIDRADEVLDAGGVLQEMKEEVARAQYPAFFRDAARLEGEAVELHVYANQAVPGLLQTEEYMRAVFGMWRPLLDEETLEQRVAARLARQHVFERRPAPLLSFVIDEAVVRRPLGGRSVMCGQLEHLLLIGALRNVEIQIMPLDREDNAGVDGPFTLPNRVGGDQVAYLEAQGRSTMVSDRREVQGIASRYGIIRAQALTPRESLAFVEKLLGEV